MFEDIFSNEEILQKEFSGMSYITTVTDDFSDISEDDNLRTFNGIVLSINRTEKHIKLIDKRKNIVQVNLDKKKHLNYETIVKNVEVDVICELNEGVSIAQFIYPSKYRNLIHFLLKFNKRELVDKFILMSTNKSEILFNSFTNDAGSNNVEYDEYFDTIEELYLKFIVSVNMYSKHQYNKIKQMFLDYKISGSDKWATLDRLKKILNINQSISSKSKHIDENLSIEWIISQLDLVIYGMNELKLTLAKQIVLHYKLGISSNMNIMLAGSPGVGKTAIIEALAKILSKPLAMISCSTLKERGELTGYHRTYTGSTSGKIADFFFLFKSTNIILFWDELDKLSNENRDGNPTEALLDIMGERKQLDDNYLDCPIYMRNTLNFASCNDISKLPEPLLNRFKIIEVPDYTIDEKLNIACNYLVPKILKNYKIEDKVIITKEALEYIILNYCDDAGARDLSNALNELLIIDSINNSDNVDHSIIKITEKIVIERLGNPKPLKNLKTIFQNNMKNYPFEIQEEIKRKKLNISNSLKGSIDHQLALRQYQFLINLYIKNHYYSINLECNMPKEFSNEIIGQNKAIQEITDLLHTQKEGNPQNILLYGPSGIGKSHLAKVISEKLGWKTIVISMKQIISDELLIGNQYTPGYLSKFCLDANTTKIIIIIENIDKINSVHDHSINNFLLNLLQIDRKIKDRYFNLDIQLTEAIIIGTATNIKSINYSILNQFNKVQMEDYTLNDIIEIIKTKYRYRLTSIYPDLDLNFFEENTLKILIEEMNLSNNLKKILQKLERLVELIKEDEIRFILPDQKRN